jgi:hypothetical protein
MAFYRHRPARHGCTLGVGLLSAARPAVRTFGDPAVETYVLSRGKLEPEYYISVVGVYTSRRSHDPCGGYLKSLRKWFLYPAKLFVA